MSEFLMLKRMRDMHMHMRTWGYSWSARDGKSSATNFFQSRSSNVAARFASGTISIAEPALDKTIVLTDNLGLCFNLKEHRVLHTPLIALHSNLSFYRVSRLVEVSTKEGVVTCTLPLWKSGSGWCDQHYTRHHVQFREE